MRTTLTLDDSLMRELRRTAADRGLSLRELVNTALRAGLDNLGHSRKQRAYRTPTFAMGYPHGGLAKALQIAAEIENEEVARKLALRK